MGFFSVSVEDIGHAIQLALAPVFLLTGIAAMLNVMTGRLARIIDRGRFLTEAPDLGERAMSQLQAREFASLDRRRHLASSAITACTFSALLVCTVIAGLFLEVLMGLDLRWLVGVVFTLAMIALIVGLAYFLREVHLATTSIRIRFTAGRRTSRESVD
jgi:thiosulfate reductase cytochrome b subunit